MSYLDTGASRRKRERKHVLSTRLNDGLPARHPTTSERDDVNPERSRAFVISTGTNVITRARARATRLLSTVSRIRHSCVKIFRYEITDPDHGSGWKKIWQNRASSFAALCMYIYIYVCTVKLAQLTAIMDQDMESAGVDAAVAPGSGVDLRLEKGEVEALHVALAAGVTERLEIGRVGPLVLIRQLLGEVVLAAATAVAATTASSSSATTTSGRQCHFRWNTLSLSLGTKPQCLSPLFLPPL